MERAWSKVALRHHPWGWMGRIGMRTLAGLAVSKCALAGEGCARAAPCSLMFYCNCFTVRCRDGATADEKLEEGAPGTTRPVDDRQAGGQGRCPVLDMSPNESECCTE